ncbi:MAG: phage holin family protein [Streptosporangiaceae bacterium]|nr:phage holin family protein [Streptosporangiaceae bacterium]MBV9857967.1 phage holin family protein [Streptosporangiaceae bacterium]
MVRSGTPDAVSGDKSLGDLVAQAAKDVSQLMRYEISLAKRELRGDVQRAAVSGALFGFCAFAGCLILVLLCFAYAYGLYAVGAPGGLWGAFLWVALTVAVLAAVAAFVARLVLRKFSGMRRTRKTVAEDVAMLRRAKEQGEDGRAVAAAEDRAQIAGRPSR